MNNNIFTFKIGGEAGQGQQVAGLIFTKAGSRAGLYTFDSSDYPSRIRGGQVTYQVSIGQEPIFGIYKTVNLLVVLSAEVLKNQLADLSPDAWILYDSDQIKNLPLALNLKKKNLKPLPLATLTNNAKLPLITKNMLAIGASAALVGFDLKALQATMAETFKDKGGKVAATNQQAAALGYDYARKNFQPENFPYKLKVKKSVEEKIVVTANEAAALGAVTAGCQLYISYPMTPATSVLHTLAKWAREVGMAVRQPEDEIAGINSAIGASWAGARVMVGTSGGGFALMTEGLALAGMTETPLVILESQRPGPATGLPTWTEQGDLAFLAHAGHGEFVRVILAPGDPTEAFYFTALAFNLAEKYQIPVFVLLDKYLSEGHQSVADFSVAKIKIDRGEMLTNAQLQKIKDFKRYVITKTGVSARSVPGQAGGIFLANSDEHDEQGFSIEGLAGEMRKKQVEKRLAKLGGVLPNLPQPQLFGPAKAAITLIGWGSTKAPVREALKYLEGVNYLHIPAPYPLDEKVITAAVRNVKKLVAIENNASGQFANLLREQTGVAVEKRLLKYDGSQFYPEEVVERVNKLN